MAKKPEKLDLDKNHPLIRAGFLHELDAMEFFGLSWSTWERNYRTAIPGKTFPLGRFYHVDQLVAWWKLSVCATDQYDDQSSDSRDEP